MSYFIEPSSQSIERALESWHWIGIKGHTPLLVTAFADVFFSSGDGIWFLDTLEGTFERTHDTKEALDRELATVEGQDQYLLAGFVDRAIREGVILEPDQCFDFKVHPKIGGPTKYDNIEVSDFVVALHIRGQIHEQTRHLPEGTRISGLVVKKERSAKPWWKIW